MRQPYSTDLSDAEWSCLEPHLPAPKATRRRRVYPLRQILNAIFYLGEERLFVALASPRLPSLAQRLDGLITNDKFCFTRRSRLKLRPKRRGYPPRKGVRRGGIDETELDRSAHDGLSRRRRPSLGPGLCAPPPLGANEANHDEGGGA